MSQTNFLIGRGELLTTEIKGPKRHPGKAEVYTLAVAQRRLAPQFTAVANTLDTLPEDACPGDFGIARLTMNPSYIARSFFPVAMLRSVGLESVGSRTVKITPDGWTRKTAPQECTTTELFVAGKRSSFRHLSTWANEVEVDSNEALDLTHVERFAPFNPSDRIQSLGNKKDHFFEIGIHLLPDEDAHFVQRAFASFANNSDVKVYSELGFRAGNLWFVPVQGKHGNIRQLANFVFVRIIRPMPKLRSLRPP